VRRAIALFAVAAVAAAVVPAVAEDGGGDGHHQIYLVGGDAESINPSQAMIDARDFFLGGYGFGSGRVANQVEVPQASDAIGNRFATGILGDGMHSRAFAVSDKPAMGDKGATIVLTMIETQGYFSAYKQGPFGENEIRQDASTEIAAIKAGTAHAACGSDATISTDAPVPSASQILVDSDHSHGGADTAGVWGGVPTSYLKEVHDQTVKAIVCAWATVQPATLSYGISHAGVSGEGQYQPSDGQHVLLHNQFSDDLNNLAMDDEIRVLQAKSVDDKDKVIATYSNFAAHPDVLGSSNTRVTGDYVGRLDLEMEKEFGGFGMDQVSTLGREQPNGDGCQQPFDHQDVDQAGKTDAELCELDSYAKLVLDEVKIAVHNAEPVTGPVAMNSYLLTDVTTSAVLAGVTYAGELIGVPAARAVNAPWYTGTVLGTPMFVGRIGQILITGGPGEMYAQIWDTVTKAVVDMDQHSGITSVMNVGTAGDFLGYIIAPLEAYPQPAFSSVASHDTDCNGVPDPAAVCPSPVDNDNYFFNISHTFGERLTCDFLRGAGDVLANDPQKYWSRYDRCPAFANDLELPVGFDTTFPEQPDLSAVMPHI
jgi:hypothetical protein